MTLEEAQTVKVGDWLECLSPNSRRRWRLVEVENVIGFHGSVRFQVRDVFVNKNGKRGNLFSRTIDLCRKTAYLPQPANIYADWLDEHGFFDAADALRKQFPI